mgnify:CR=1 FL=1
MAVNHNVNPRPLTAEEKENRARGVYDSFATYVVFCGHCRYVRKTNMYIMRAEAFIDELKARGEVCPQCGRQEWTLGYPMGTTTAPARACFFAQIPAHLRDACCISPKMGNFVSLRACTCYSSDNLSATT